MKFTRWEYVQIKVLGPLPMILCRLGGHPMYDHRGVIGTARRFFYDLGQWIECRLIDINAAPKFRELEKVRADLEEVFLAAGRPDLVEEMNAKLR